MANLYDTARAFQKKDITSLAEIDLKKVEVKEDVTEKGIKYKYIEIDGWKYTLKAEVLSGIKELVDMRPATTKVKVFNKDGTFKVIPLD